MKQFIIANFKKNKGTSIFAGVLVCLATALLMLGLCVALNLDSFYVKKAKENNSPDIYMELRSQAMIDEKNLIDDIRDSDNVSDVYEYDALLPDRALFYLNSKKQENTTLFMNYDTDYKSLKPVLIEKAERTVKKPIILPYQFALKYGYNLNDLIEFTIDGERKFTYEIAGFYEDVLTGSTAIGINRIYLHEDEYKELERINTFEAKCLYIFLDDKSMTDKTKIALTNLFDRYDLADVNAYVLTLGDVRGNGLMFANLIAVMLIMFAIVVGLVALLSVSFSISTAIDNSIKEVGIMKASGFRSSQIRRAFWYQYLIIAAIGIIAGFILAKSFSGVVGNTISSTISILWNMKLDGTTIIITIIMMIILIRLTVKRGTKKIKKMEAIQALSMPNDGTTLKKNYLHFKNTKLDINTAIALKSILNSPKQSVMTVVITALLMLMVAISTTLYYNLVVDNSVVANLLGKPNASATITLKDYSDKRRTNQIKRYVENLDGVKYVEKYTYSNGMLIDGKYEIYINMSDDYDNLQMNSLIEGHFPKSSGEISISVDLKEKLGKGIGDNIYISLPMTKNKKVEYKVCGITQVLGGSATEMTFDGAKRLLGDWNTNMLCIYTYETADIGRILAKVENRFPKETIKTHEEIMISELSTYTTPALILALMIIAVTLFTVILIILLVIKVRMHNERQYFGILKTIGYISDQIAGQLALSMMLLVGAGIGLGTILGMLLSSASIVSLLAGFGGIYSATIITPWSYFIAIAVILLVFTYYVLKIVCIEIKTISAYDLISE